MILIFIYRPLENDNHLHLACFLLQRTTDHWCYTHVTHQHGVDPPKVGVGAKLDLSLKLLSLSPYTIALVSPI